MASIDRSHSARDRPAPGKPGRLAACAFLPPYSAYARDLRSHRAARVRRADGRGRARPPGCARNFVPRSVLDLGCGTGSATLAFARVGIETVGVDRSAAMLMHAREAAILSGHSGFIRRSRYDRLWSSTRNSTLSPVSMTPSTTWMTIPRSCVFCRLRESTFDRAAHLFST